MKIAIMQPYFFPYIGYWQLVHAVDKFVVYDNIQYSKGGWINRNRILLNGKDRYITLPLKKDSDYLDIRERALSDNFDFQKGKLLNQIKYAYQKAPYFNEIFPLIKTCIEYENANLFEFLYHSITCLAEYMKIKTQIIISSQIKIESDLRKEERVLAVCKALTGTHYINPIGGITLYQKDHFKTQGLHLDFLKSCTQKYRQNTENFVPDLSIIDVLMYNSLKRVQEMLEEFILI